MSTTTSIVTGVDFIAIPTQDYEKADAFYGDVSASSARSGGGTCPPASSRTGP